MDNADYSSCWWRLYLRPEDLSTELIAPAPHQLLSPFNCPGFIFFNDPCSIDSIHKGTAYFARRFIAHVPTFTLHYFNMYLQIAAISAILAAVVRAEPQPTAAAQLEQRQAQSILVGYLSTNGGCTFILMWTCSFILDAATTDSMLLM